jgi:hypothetical protein
MQQGRNPGRNAQRVHTCILLSHGTLKTDHCCLDISFRGDKTLRQRLATVSPDEVTITERRGIGQWPPKCQAQPLPSLRDSESAPAGTARISSVGSSFRILSNLIQAVSGTLQLEVGLS